DIPSFKGWYIPHETNTKILNIKEIMGGLAALCKDKTPDKRVLVSPFFNSSLFSKEPFTPQRTAEEWDDIWEKAGKDIDDCAFQDGTSPLEDYEGYLKAMKGLCDKHNISLWANVETFERDVRRMYFPIPFDLMRKRIEIAEPYVDKMITFEFSHFLSPQSIFPSAQNLNNLYKRYYGGNK
ncbi:MAG: DUF5109 domain-containing protein, partial [Clostridia bacterium]|nr:DUF5109 domain-containing protein [Clostridia bacterium]